MPPTSEGSLRFMLVILSAVYLALIGIYDLPLVYFIYDYYGSLTLLAIIQNIGIIGDVIMLLTVTTLLDLLGPFRSYLLYMILSSFTFTSLSLFLPALGIYNPVVIALFILRGIVAGMFLTILNTILPSIYSKDQLVRANSIFWAVRYAVGVLLLVAGYLVDVIGVANALLLMGAILSIISLSAAAVDVGVMRTMDPSAISSAGAERRGALRPRYFVEGAYYLYRNRAVLRLIVYATIVSIPSSVIFNLYPVAIARALFGEGAFFLGLIVALIAAMASAGSIAVARIYGRFVKGREILFMLILVISMGLLSLALSASIALKGQVVALSILLLMSFVSLMYEVTLGYVNQSVIPREIRARIFGIRWAISYSASITGSIASGRLADLVGIDQSVAILSTLFFIVGLVGLLDRGFRRLV